MAAAPDAGRKNMAMDVMMMLEGEALTQVYTVFKDKNDREDGSGLSQTEFVSAVLKYLPRRYLQTLDKVDLVMQLSELFAQVRVPLEVGGGGGRVASPRCCVEQWARGGGGGRERTLTLRPAHPCIQQPPSQIDVNGDGELEWSEFTQFCVEAGVTTRTIPTADFSYKFDAAYHDTVAHRGVIQAMLYEESTKEMIVVEGGSSEVKLFKSGEGLEVECVCLWEGAPCCACSRVAASVTSACPRGVVNSARQRPPPPPCVITAGFWGCLGTAWSDLHAFRTLRTEENSTKLAKDAGAASCVSVEVCRSRRALAVSQSNHVISVWSMDNFAYIGSLPCHSNPQVMCW
jgi:hypothetical protein